MMIFIMSYFSCVCQLITFDPKIVIFKQKENMDQLDISQITDENIKIFDSINILGLFIVESLDNMDDSDILNKINPWLKMAKEVIYQSSKAKVDINSNNILEVKQRVNKWINANNTINTIVDKLMNILSEVKSRSTNIDAEYLKS
ncbi:unnamed protein product, partial [marine sediment metagenome]